MKPRFFRFALLAAALSLLASCSSNSVALVVGLKVELTGIAQAADGTTTVDWRVVNPNIAPYLLSRINNKIYLNGTLVGTTSLSSPLPVPVQSEAKKSSKLVPAGAAAARILADAANHGPVSYRVDSALTVLIYGDTTQDAVLSSTGTVAVAGR